MANYGAWQAAAEGLNSLSKTGMGLMQMEAQRKHQEALEKDSAARLQMAREQADREKIAWQHAEDKRIQEEKVKKAIIPATLYNKGFHQDQRVRQQYIETMKTMGYKVDDVDGEIFAPMEAFEKVGTLMKAGSDYTALQAKNKMDDLKDKSIAITSQINELMASGKDDDKTAEQINKLKQKKLAIVSEIAESMNLRDSILEAKAKKQAEEDVLQPGRIALANAKPTPEVNIANEIETILGGMFPGYYTDKDVRKKALAYYATPEGSKIVQAKVAEFARQKTPPQFVPVPTTEGIVPFQTRGGGAGKMGEPSGQSKPLPEGAAKELGALSGLKDTIKKIGELYKPEYVGPVAGRVAGVQEQLVNLPSDQVQFYAYTRDAKDALLRARSGAQINEQEYARLVKFLPDENLPSGNFEARRKRFEDEVDIIMRAKKKVYEGQGYKIGDDIISGGSLPAGLKAGW